MLKSQRIEKLGLFLFNVSGGLTGEFGDLGSDLRRESRMLIKVAKSRDVFADKQSAYDSFAFLFGTSGADFVGKNKVVNFPVKFKPGIGVKTTEPFRTVLPNQGVNAAVNIIQSRAVVQYVFSLINSIITQKQNVTILYR